MLWVRFYDKVSIITQKKIADQEDHPNSVLKPIEQFCGKLHQQDCLLRKVFNLKCDLTISLLRMQQWITAGGHHKYVKIHTKTPLQKHHIKNRFSFANKYVHCIKLFGHVIFSYEKTILEEHLPPFITITADDDIIFQLDNAPIHTATSINIFSKPWD